MTTAAQEKGLNPVGKTVRPDVLVSKQDFETAFNNYKGQQGMDGIYERTLPNGETEFWVGESKTTGDPSPKAPTTDKGSLETTKAGFDQLSDDWIRSNLGKSGLSAEKRAQFEEALKKGKVRKFYAQTDKKGTHFYAVTDVNSKTVKIDPGRDPFK
jgi:hypothetical protein